jgi:hypothetical protein
MAIAVVQHKAAFKGSGGDYGPTVTIDAPAAGNALVVIGTAHSASHSINSVSGGGVTWARATGMGAALAEVWIGQNSSGSGTTVVVTTNDNGAYSAGVIELSGVATTGDLVLAVAQTDYPSATTTAVTPDVTPASGKNCLIVGGISRNAGDTTAGPTNSFTNTGGAYTAYLSNFAHLLVSSAGGSAYNTAYTITSSAYYGAAAAIGDGATAGAAFAPQIVILT